MSVKTTLKDETSFPPRLKSFRVLDDVAELKACVTRANELARFLKEHGISVEADACSNTKVSPQTGVRAMHDIFRIKIIQEL